MANEEARLWAKVNKTDGCWLWTGGRTAPGWHGIIMWNGKRGQLVHRISWELHNGPIPEGMLVLHKCDVPPCVRPDHLFLGTYGDNMRDCSAKGRLGSQNRVWTHCKRGHLFTPENTLHPHGRRRCKRCAYAALGRDWQGGVYRTIGGKRVRVLAEAG